MTDPTQRARVRAAIAHSTGKTVDTLTDAVMAALAEPTPEPRRVEFTSEERGYPLGRPALTVTWDGTFYRYDKRFLVSAVNVATDIATSECRDAIASRLLALRGDAKPSWWVNERDSIAATFAYDTEADAIRTSKQNPGVNYTRIAVPVYDHPPVPRAPQSETREVIGHAVIRANGSVVRAWWLNGKDGHRAFHRTEALELTRRAGHEDCTVVELLRGADVPLVHAERAP